MARLWRLLKWLLVGAGVTLAVTILAGVIYTRSENFNRWLREQAVALVNDSIQGTISVERLEGSVWHQLTLFDVALRHRQVEILRIPRAQAAFSLLPLIRGRLEISRIDALKPYADLRQDRDGNWNVVEAFAPREPEAEQSSAFTIAVRSLRLHDAGMDLRIGGSAEKNYHLRNLNLEGGVGLLPDGVSLEVRELASTFAARGLPDLSLKGALDYRQLAGAPPTFKFNDLWAVSHNSRLKLDGEIIQGGALQVKARARIDKLSPVDIAYFVSDWPLRRDVAGELAAEGSLDDLHGKLNLTGAGARLSARLRADVVQTPPRYSATMTLAGFDLRQWLGRTDVAGVVRGNLETRGQGFALNDIGAKTDLEVGSLEIQGWTLGALVLQGRLEKSVAILDGRLASKAGAANWSGKLALQGKQPAYEASIAVNDFDPASAGAGSALKGKVNLQGIVRGSGFDVADLNARADVRVQPSSLGSVNFTDGQVEASLRNRRISIARAALRTAESSLALNGELGLDRSSAGKLSYRLRSADVAPWLRLIDQQGSGSIDLTGEARGSFVDLEARGTIRGNDLKVGGAAARSADVNYTLRGSPDRLFPEGVVSVRVADFDAGLALRRIDGRATFMRAPGQSIDLDVSALDQAERKHATKAVLHVAPEGLTLRLDQLLLTAPDGAWRLARPASVSRRKDTFVVEQLALRNGARAITLDGRFGFAGEQALRLDVDRLPLEVIAGLLSGAPKMTGLIAARAQIGGTAAAPEINANLKISDPTIAAQPYQGADAVASYTSKRARLRLAMHQDANHVLTVEGVVPLLLSWQDRWRAEPGDGMEVRAHSSGLSLSFLNAFAGKAAENIAGEVALDITARGSIKQPDLRGTFALRDGRVRVVPAGVDITAITLGGVVEPRNLILREFSARAKDGEIRASGSIALKQYEIGAAKIFVNAKRWPAIDTSRYQVRVGGNLEIGGTLDAPVIQGRVNVTEGSLRPDLNFLEQSKAPTKRDETITIVRNGVAIAPAAVNQGAAVQAGALGSLVLDIAVRAPRNLWIRHPDLQAELSGNVRVVKARQRDLDLTGRVEIVRGWIAFQGRRFQLTRGRIEFTGGDKITPSLDIVAQYKLPQYQVDVTVSGTVDKPALTLTSQPRLEQADILAVLLFGRPMNELNESEQGSLQQSAINLTSGFVAGKIANSVSSALGLDQLGIDIRQVDFGGGRLGVGRYVGRRTYLSLSQELTGERGQGVGLEYELARDLKIGTSASSSGSNAIDIIWHKRY